MTDREGWQATNPALGHRMTEGAITAALKTDPEDVFRTEVLCQWVTQVDSAINTAVWDSLADPDAEWGTGVVFALDVAPDQSTSSISVAWRRPDGAAHVMLADRRLAVEWVVGRASDLTRQWRDQVVLEQTGTAVFLIPEVEARSGPVAKVTRRFYADACSALDAAVTARTLRHGNQPDLTAVTVARWG